jgi:anti-sigma factor RsiW
MGLQNMGRRFDRHIDNRDLNALVPSSSEAGQELYPDAVLEAKRHVESCEDCNRKVSKYRQFVNQSNVVVTKAAAPGAECPKDKDVDWHEVAAGLWPELKARQLIMHAALCDHCGPLLRAATPLNDDPTPQEEKLLAQLEAPSRPTVKVKPESISPDLWPPPGWRQFRQWKMFVPAVALLGILGVLGTTLPLSPTPLSGPKFAKFAVSTHRQHAHGRLALDVHSESQQTLNLWFKAKSPFVVALPASPVAPGEERPYRLEGARLVAVGSRTAAYIAYQMQTGPVSLIVTPNSVAVASGGVKVDFRKVSFHYRMVEGYKVVTWSVHGLTYALVSQEGSSTQGSCMVCHSAMRDRDLSQTPTPLGAAGNAVEPLLQ